MIESKYDMADINCEYCTERKRTKYKTCGYRLCPYIMDNLLDLLNDRNFSEAIKNAEKCTALYRYTLRYLKKEGIEQCGGCRYLSPGFVCRNEKDGTCLKNWTENIQSKGDD